MTVVSPNKFILLTIAFTLSGGLMGAPAGPIWPPPGGAIWSYTPDLCENGVCIGRTGGRTEYFDLLDPSAYDQLWSTTGLVGSAMDGFIDPAEVMSFDPAQSTPDRAVWTGSTIIITATGPQSVDTRYSVTLEGTSGVNSDWVDPTSIFLNTGEVDRAAEVLADPFSLHRFMEAKFTASGIYEPFLEFFDLHKAQDQSGNARMQYYAYMYYTGPAVNECVGPDENFDTTTYVSYFYCDVAGTITAGSVEDAPLASERAIIPATEVIVASGAKVSYSADVSVELFPGFSVELGGEFTAGPAASVPIATL